MNEKIIRDIIYIESTLILYIDDEGARFSSARFFMDIRSETVWNTLLRLWAKICTCLPNSIVVDKGTHLKNKSVHVYCHSRQFEIRVLGNESTNLSENQCAIPSISSLNFEKIRISSPSADRNILLQLRVKAINDTMGPKDWFYCPLFSKNLKVHSI